MRIESLLSARLFIAAQLADDYLYFISDLSGRLSLYRMLARRAGSVPEALLPPNIALPNPHLTGGLPFQVFPGLGQLLVMLDQDGAADWREDSGKAPLMFQKVRSALGEVALGECYGFVPALKLGGQAKVENVRRMSALEHFSILAQLGPVELFDYSDMSQKFVRHLGG